MIFPGILFILLLVLPTDTPNATPAPSRSNSAEKQREGNNQTGTKAWWQPFKSDGDQSGNKLIKWNEMMTKIRKNGESFFKIIILCSC